MMRLPIALDVQGRKCLVVGGGEIAARKATTLLDCGARVTVVAPQWCAKIETLSCTKFRRTFSRDDCADCTLVFACTNLHEVNAEVVRAARELGALCNVVDGDAGDFAMMATVRRGDITVGISTQGGSPALARHLKARIEESIGEEYAALLEILAARRAAMKSEIGTQSARADLWRRVLQSEVLSLLRQGKRSEAEQCVDEILGSNPNYLAPGE